jgi:hypothetical protein
MIVTKQLLPILIRQTVMNAYRVVRNSSDAYERPLVTRLKLIQEIEQKFLAPSTDLAVLKTMVLSEQPQQQ